MGKPRDTKIAILPSTTRKGTTLSTSAALDSPSVISKLVSPPQASNSAESENSSYNCDDASAVLDNDGSLGSFLDATIARSRQIENTETPNENAATPVNSPESVEYSSDDLDEDYVELDDDFIEKCNATTDARKIKKLLAEHAKRTPDDAEELLAKIGRNHDDWSTPEPTPTPILKKMGMIKLNDEDMREAKKSLKEKGIKPEDVKNPPPIEDLCKITPPSSMIEDPLYPEGHPKRVEQDSQLTKTSAPSKKKKKKHKNVVESSEPVNDPNSISISDAETESGNEHDKDNDKNDTPDKEEVEEEPEKHAKNKKYTKEDFIAEKHGAVIDCNKGKVTFNVDDKEHTVYFPKRIDKDFEFHRSQTNPMVRYKIYNKTINLPFSDFCAAIRVPQWGSCEKVRGTPRELSNLYTMICNGRSFSDDGGKISSIQQPAIRYFAYFVTKNPSNEIFSELDEITARVLFLHEASKTEGESVGPRGSQVTGGAACAPAAPPVPRALVPPLDLPFRLLKASVTKPPASRGTIRKTFRDAAANPISGIQRSPPHPAGEGIHLPRTLHRHDRSGG
ncbi:hypothetical protein QYE76_012961 [Lolium multiflorum]|uniref:Uncharacterized protein n=1 Tax=Lolium multiflorum TaxID=4521 RepID=A0AAD8U1Y5_LOLMU|nr:hypothetical protein QYE76_012961 [Lolium multiflorum]